MRHNRAITTFVLVLFTVVLNGCRGMQSSIDPAGPQSNNIAGLWWLMFYTCSAVFILVTIFLLIALRRGIKKSGHANSPAQTPPELVFSEDGELRKRNVVVAATAVTIVVLFVFLLESFLVGRAMTAELSVKNGVAVEINGRQWWWEVRYPNDDASSYFTTANEVHIPVGVPVTFNLKAGDVIHSFWVPNLSGKKDLIPGKSASIWLQADRPGEYRGQCAEYCGHQHAHMAFRVIAESPEQFAAWRQAQIQSAREPATDSQRRGREVFLTSPCVMCHTINGTAAGSNIGPNLTHIASRKMIAADTLPNTRDNLRQWIVDSQQIKPGNRMPPNKLSNQDLEALLDYLQSLQ